MTNKQREKIIRLEKEIKELKKLKILIKKRDNDIFKKDEEIIRLRNKIRKLKQEVVE